MSLLNEAPWNETPRAYPGRQAPVVLAVFLRHPACRNQVIPTRGGYSAARRTSRVFSFDWKFWLLGFLVLFKEQIWKESVFLTT